MAGVRVAIPSGEVALTAAAATVVLSVIAAANHRILIKSLSVCGKGIVTTDTPMKVELVRITNDGAASGVTEVKINEGDNETIQTVGKHTYTVAPTVGEVVQVWEVHPQTGLVLSFGPGDEIVVIGGNACALRVTAAQNQTVSANFIIEE